MSDKVEKINKRKRSTDGSLKPSKRVAIEGDRPVKLNLHQAEKWAPVIASTPGVVIPSTITLKPYTKARRNVPQRQGRSGDITNKELLLHSSEHQKLDYTAREEEASSLLKHYVGIYDPETGELEVLEARKMTVRGVVRSHQNTIEDEILSTNIREQRNILGQTFGTKKARKAIQSITENAISPDKALRNPVNGTPRKLDSAATAMLESMAPAALNVATQDDLSKMAEDAKPRPKVNEDATEISDVYTIDNLIGLDTLKYVPVKAWQDAVKANREVHTSSQFVAYRIARCAANVEKLKILKYMLLMLDFLRSSKLKGKGGNREIPKRDDLKKIIGDMPETVLEGLKRKFSDGGIMSKFQADTIITHLCALSLLVDNFETDTTNLKDDLSLEPATMAKYYNEIGVKCTQLGKAEAKRRNINGVLAAQRSVAKLKLPLVFPKQSVGKRGR